MRRIVVVALLAAMIPAGARAEVKTRTVEYEHDGVTLEGLVAWDDARQGKRPGVLIVHDWMGVGPFVAEQAERLARDGYVAFAADIYGKGVRPKDTKEAAAQAGKYRGDRALLRARAAAGLAELRKSELTGSKVAAIGYCFGGGTVLELARSGADVAGVVSFHGNLDTPNAADAKSITGKVLVLHGADDPYVPADQVAAFEKEMRDAKVDWQMVHFGGAVHSFTNPRAGDDPSKGAAYDERAARRAWAHMQQLFAELFPR
ncbi:MAG: dienelactone hydrolase [Myxococcales bacterium]